MQLCLAQAQLARAICPPNPAVGAVLVDGTGKILGLGHTQKRGGPHAEIMALRHAREQGHDTAGATLYVSLEPCSHQGLTPPCTNAVVEAGIKKVVASVLDPNPLVYGRGIAQLRAAGIQIEVGSGAAESRELNIGFFSRMIRKRPWVRMKAAATLDGRMALENGSSRWITSGPARMDGHHWRARACAILTGIGTILNDDPSLNVRLPNAQRQPDLFVIDSHLRTPTNASIFATQRQVTIFTAILNKEKQAALEARGAKVMYLPCSLTERTKVDLVMVLRDLAAREINELHVEAGPQLNGALLEAKLVDELILYQAPKLVGEGLPIAKLPNLRSLSDAVPLEFSSIDLFTPDIRIICRVVGHSEFLIQ